MGRRANWCSLARNDGFDANKKRKLWEEFLVKDAPKQADRLAMRKDRLIALFGSTHCYSANVHADKNDLNNLVKSLLKLDRLPEQTPHEGLMLLSQAWDEHRSK